MTQPPAGGSRRPDLRTLRVAFVATAATSLPFVAPVADALTDRGHQAHIFAGPDVLGIRPESSPETFHSVAGLRRRGGILGLVDPARELARHFRTLKVDAVVSSTPKAMLAATTAALSSRVPVRLLWFWGLPAEGVTGARGVALRLLDSTLVRANHVSWFNSLSLLEVAAERHPSLRGRFVYNPPGTTHGIPDQYFGPPREPEPDRLTLGFVGRLAADKGVDGLVDTFLTHLVPRLSAVTLRLVGPVDDRDPVSSRTLAAIESSDRIVWDGAIEDTAGVYGDFDLLCFPSFREGFPNAPLEAAARAVPTVGFAATGTRDAVPRGTGRLVPLGDWDGFWKEVEGLCRNPSARLRLGEAAREHAMSLEQHAVVGGHAAFLEGLIERLLH
jgi:glycosyltransferase involved in cell wall biosynthesis